MKLYLYIDCEGEQAKQTSWAVGYAQGHLGTRGWL